LAFLTTTQYHHLSDLTQLKSKIFTLAEQHGFQQAAITDIDTSKYFEQFSQWVEHGYHGNMSYLERNQELRKDPGKLHPNTSRIISLRYNYLPEGAQFKSVLADTSKANISRYALGKDYHKRIRKKLKSLCKQINDICEQGDFRVFVDSAPILETAIAEKAGLGWKGKHTLLLNKEAGSFFFLAEVFINIPLPIDEPVENHCGNCNSCIKLCPTDAIIAPYKLDARRCISYLTIENNGPIPIEFREAIGNRIYGCDDCQLACPWNRFSQTSKDLSFSARLKLDDISLLELFNWSETEFLSRLEGSPIRRIGYQNWLRNIAIALGNGNSDKQVIDALKSKANTENSLLAEHIKWSINRLEQNKNVIKSKSVTPSKTEKLIRTIEKMLPRDA
jgi:epoxyqueuosine reductase